MHTYDTSEGTVTLTINEYADLVYQASKVEALIACGCDKLPEVQEAMLRLMHQDLPFSMQELDVVAFRIMEDEEASDYILSVAYEWLQMRCKPIPDNVAEWCAIMRDLEDQLTRIAHEDYEQMIRESVEETF